MKRTMILTLVFFVATTAFGKIGVPDLKIVKLSDERYLYSGHVIESETGEPITEGYVYLVSHDMQLGFGQAVDDEGYFEIEANSGNLSAIYSPTELESRLVRNQSHPLMDAIGKFISEKYPRQDFGRAALILDSQSEILISDRGTILKLKRDFSEGIRGFDGGEVAASLFFEIQKFKAFRKADLCRVEISYIVERSGEKTKLLHTILQVTLEPEPGKTIVCYLDPTPFSASPITIRWKPAVIKKKALEIREHLRVAQSTVPLSPSAPLLAMKDLQLWGGITVDGNLVVVQYSIFRIRPAGADGRHVKIEKAFDAQITVPKDKWEHFQAWLVKKPEKDFTAKLPTYAKLYSSGSIDQQMFDAEDLLEKILHEMIKKARLVFKGKMG